jgi:cytochrome b
VTERAASRRVWDLPVRVVHWLLVVGMAGAYATHAAGIEYFAAMPRGATSGHAGHNPLGAWMVVFLLAGLAAQGITGLFANDEIFNTGPLYGYVSDTLSLKLTSWHRRIFDWLLIAVVLHVLAVLAHRLLAKHDLIGPMFTGRKHARLVPDSDVIYSSRLWLAVLLLAALACGLAWLVARAPEAGLAAFD